MVNSEFEKRVYKKLKKVPKGKITTYGELARVIGAPRAARAIGNTLNKNPFAPKVPCHRVVRFNGELGGYARGALKKKELLEKEGIVIEKGKIKDFEKVLYKF